VPRRFEPFVDVPGQTAGHASTLASGLVPLRVNPVAPADEYGEALRWLIDIDIAE
jgi:hypothetical protein